MSQNAEAKNEHKYEFVRLISLAWPCVAQVDNAYCCTAETQIHSWVVTCEIIGGRNALEWVFLRVIRFPQLKTHLSPLHKVCGSPDQVADCDAIRPKLGA
jgi:hypothetical protein